MTALERQVAEVLTFADNKAIDRLTDDALLTDQLIIWLAPRVAAAIEAAGFAEPDVESVGPVIGVPNRILYGSLAVAEAERVRHRITVKHHAALAALRGNGG